MHQPSVTCICNTRKRPHFLERAIKNFNAQTYENKELLITYEDDDDLTHQIVSGLNSPNIKTLRIPSAPEFTLGTLRNLAVESCSSEVICVWDDDDWYHVDRIKVQVASLLSSHKPVCVMAYLLLFNCYENQAYLSQLRTWENSVVCLRSAFNDEVKYGDLERSEDLVLVEQFIKLNMIYPILVPHLYTYVLHGKNTWDHDHRNLLCSEGRKLSKESSLLLQDILNGKYSFEEGSELLQSPQMVSQFRYIP
jgi:glycosyltransferase involved in cell wall biosynthesis